MKVEKRDGGQERLILTAMIVSTSVVRRLADKWPEEGLFPSSWSNLLADWCVRYYNRYGKAPKGKIESLFRLWTEKRNANPEMVKLVEKYLSTLSRQYERRAKEVNPDFVIDVASKYFDRIRHEKFFQHGVDLVAAGKIKEAQEHREKFVPLEIGAKGHTVNPFEDYDLLTDALEERRESLIKYPGKLGDFFGDTLERSGFVAILAPEKRGKSFWMLDMAFRGSTQRRKVAFFEAGDNTQKQWLRRFVSRAAKRPAQATRPGTHVRYPTSLEVEYTGDGDGDAKVGYKELTWDADMTPDEMKAALKKVKDTKIRSRDPYLKLSCHPNSSLTVAGIRHQLDVWYKHDRWTPDVVVIDYADILAPSPGFKGETRDGVNEIWKALRRLSQERSTLVVTATQANAASYTAKSLGMHNFSEDKRKFAHVTGMLTINQEAAEKEKGVQRLGWVVLRDEEFHTTRFVHCAGCLAVANPCVLSA